MQENKMNSILFLKNIESNVIEEAVIVIKGNVKLHDKLGHNKIINKDTILKEAELIINNKIEENDKSFLQFKISKLIKKNKILRIYNIAMTILLIILILT